MQSAIGPRPATQPIRALKTAFTDRISTTVFAADPDLSVTVAAVDYILTAYLRIEGLTPNPGFKWRWAAPALSARSTSQRSVSDALGGLVAGESRLDTSYTTQKNVTTLAASAEKAIYIRGLLRPTAAGTFELEWAQLVSSVDFLRLHAGSWLRLEQVN